MAESDRPFKNGMPPIHPGEVLTEELIELDMSVSGFAESLGAPSCHVKAILQRDEGITGEIALRLSRYFGTTAELWMNLQSTYELRVAELTVGPEIERQVTPRGKEPS